MSHTCRHSTCIGVKRGERKRMPLPYSGAALFAGGADEFVRMAPASSLTAHVGAHLNLDKSELPAEYRVADATIFG